MKRLPTDFLSLPISHRTLHDIDDGRPENSIEGAEAAIAAGYGIEIDLQLSSDGVPMVFHDYELSRLTKENGAVAQRSAANLRAIPLSGGKQGIPSLPEFLELVSGRVPLLIEMKDQDGALGPRESQLESATCAALSGYDGPVALMSFNPHMVARVAKLAPHIPRGIVTDPFKEEDWGFVPENRRKELASIPDFDRVDACFISHKMADLESDAVAKVKAKGADILCWTVKSAQQEVEARKIANNITFEGYLAEFSE